jgi:hypothetical protein
MSHPTPTFAELAALEPQLAEQLAEAKSHRASPTFCANAVFYGYTGHRPGLKQRLSKLAGYSVRLGPLSTSAAYDTAYHTIYQALPDCGPDCVCQGW